MTGAVQKICAIGAALAVCLGLVIAPYLNGAFAQDEPEPEASPIEQPQAEPTEWVPITAGDVARGAPVATPEASTPAEASSPLAVSSPAAPPAAPWHTTIGRDRTPPASSAAAMEPAEVPSPAAVESPAPSAKPAAKEKSAKSGNGPQIVPPNSPFGNFGNQKGPIDINSDTGTLDYQNKFFLYTGHVHAVQAGGDLTCDKLRVQYGQDFNDIRMLYADGNVRMSQGTRWITSDHAVLDQTKHILTFHGNPVVHDGEDQITGSVITVDLVSGKSNVENPRMVIFPRESKNPDNGDAP